MHRLIASFLLLLAVWVSGVRGEESQELGLGKAWAETVLGDPERAPQTGRGLAPLPETAYSFKSGSYQSVVSRISLKLPRVGDERVVSVREAVVFRRPDGQAITTHVIFVPGPIGMVADDTNGVSAVVVTRLRDDRPKDRESVLRRFEPASDQERRGMEAAGLSSTRVMTQLGEAVQRIIPNRLTEDPFPYRTKLRTSESVVTMGISRVAVVEGEDGSLTVTLDALCGGDEKLTTFFRERVDYYFREVRGFAYDEVNAVMAAGYAGLPDALARLEAVQAVRPTADFEPLAAAFKRIKNILKQAGEIPAGAPDATLFTAPEAALAAATMATDVATGTYPERLARVALLRPAVDAFFDKVLVNDPDPKLRENRLRILTNLIDKFSSIADFSEIVTN